MAKVTERQYQVVEGKHNGGEKNPDGTDKVYRKGEKFWTRQDLTEHGSKFKLLGSREVNE